MPQTVLITGATGFLGAHITLEFLRSGYNVKAVCRNEASIQKAEKIFAYYSIPTELFRNLEWIIVDLSCYEEVENALVDVEYVVHAAAEVSFNSRKKNQLIESNTRITAILANASLEKKVKKFCHISSIATLGTPINGESVSESTKWTSERGNSGYSISKFYAEMEVWRAMHSGLNAVILNPSIILGPGVWGTSSTALISNVAKGLPFYTSGSSGFVDVRDVARASRITLESEISFDRFIVSSQNVTFKELLGAIALQLNVKAPSVKISPIMAKSIALITELIAFISGGEPRITLDAARAASKVRAYSGQKLEETLKFTYTPVGKVVEFTCQCYNADHRKC